MLRLRIFGRQWLLGLLIGSTVSVPAMATLGEPAYALSATANARGAAIRANALRASTTGGSITVRETLQDDGIVLQEYTNAAGIVFAIAWRGPGFPDLKNLMGKYFDSYKAATELPGQSRTLGGSVQFERPGLVVRTNGRMRSFVGIAVATDWMPAGVVVDDLLP